MGPLKIRKPSAILFDIIGTATKSHFIDKVLFAYIRTNAKTYLKNYWDNSVLQHDVKMLREQAKKDKPPGKIPDEGADPESIRAAVAAYAIKSLEELKDNEALTQFKFHILFDGYTKGGIETQVYTDVAIAIRHWAIDDNIQLYVFSNGWREATKRYLEKTNHGNLNLLIAGHFDTQEGPLTDSATYNKVLKQVKHPAEDVLFLTHSGAEGRAAKMAGLSVVLITTHRRDLNKLTLEEKKELPHICSFNELIFTGDAPKACQLDGSSVVDDKVEDKGKSNKSSAPKSKSKSKDSTGSKSKPKSKDNATKEGKAKSFTKHQNQPKSKQATRNATRTKSSPTEGALAKEQPAKRTPSSPAKDQPRSEDLVAYGNLSAAKEQPAKQSRSDVSGLVPYGNLSNAKGGGGRK